MAEPQKNSKLIHVGRIRTPEGIHYLFLRLKSPHSYVWYRETDDKKEIEEPVSAPHYEEALRLANRHWKNENFQTLNCGFKYTLPERDEHGTNALFHQMAASYSNSNGIYFDEELGNNCFVNFAPQEAQDLWQRLKQEGKL